MVNSRKNKKTASWWTRKVILNLSFRAELYKDLELEYAGGGNIIHGLQTIIPEMAGPFANARKEHLATFMGRIENGQSLNAAVGSLFPSHEKLFLEAIWSMEDKAQGYRLMAARASRQKAGNMAALIKLLPGIFISIIAIGLFHFAGGEIGKAVASADVPVRLGTMEAASVWFNAQAILVIIAIGSLPIWLLSAIVWSLSNWTGVTRRLVDNIGPWRLYRESIGAAVLINIAEMHRSGIGFKEALNTLSEDAGPWMRNILITAYHSVVAGDRLGVALGRTGTEIPNTKILKHLKRIENTAEFSANLTNVVETHASQVHEETEAKISSYAFALMMAGLLAIASTYPLMFAVSRITKIGMQSHLF